MYMPLNLQEKMLWLEQVSNTLVTLINKEHESNGTPKDGEKEVAVLGEELAQGFHWITNELKKLHTSAALEFYNWAILNVDLFGTLFQLKSNAFEQAPEDLVSLLQKFIPQKYIHYFFLAARNLYNEKEMLKADRIFRLLTLLYPQHADFWIWLGLSQLQRHLPELALISNTIAAVLDRKNPFPFYYMSQCWMQLKGWDQAKNNLKECLDTIGTDSSFQQLKIKCQETQVELLKEASILNNYIPQIVVYQEMTMTPRSAINNLYSNRSKETPFTSFITDQWKAFFNELKKQTEHLANQLNNTKESFNHEINTLDFFEQHSITLTQKTVKIPITSFSKICALALGLFFGELVAGISISSDKKIIQGKIQTNNSFKIAHTFSEFLDQCEPEQKKSISKYAYLYNSQMDIAFNQEVMNTEFGSSQASYQENVREDNRIRVSQFHRKDIVGKSILDCGCNEGGVLFECRNIGAKTITGFDLNPWCISQANELVSTQKIKDAHFYVGDMENQAFLSTLPMSDTVLLLAVLDTSNFVNKTAVISNLSRFAKNTLYYEGHLYRVSHVPRMYELLIATDFTRFEYLGIFAGRILIRCSRELMEKYQLPPNAITSDASDAELLSASEIYLFTNSPKNPPFSNKCKLIQFVKNS